MLIIIMSLYDDRPQKKQFSISVQILSIPKYNSYDNQSPELDDLKYFKSAQKKKNKIKNSIKWPKYKK